MSSAEDLGATLGGLAFSHFEEGALAVLISVGGHAYAVDARGRSAYGRERILALLSLYFDPTYAAFQLDLHLESMANEPANASGVTALMQDRIRPD